MNIAIFGGSFDPPHNAHLAIAKSAIATLNIDLLLIIPAFLNPFKTSVFADGNLRLKWCKMLFSELAKTQISDYEILKMRPVASIESIKHFKSLYNPSKIYLIIGADNLANLQKWHNYDELCALCEFVIAKRNDIAINSKYKILNINEKISSTFIRNKKDFSKIPPLLRQEISEFYTKRIKMQDRINKIIEILDAKKAENAQAIDMSGRDYIAKFVIIATTLHARHALSLIDELKTHLKPLGEQFLGSECSDEWSVIDLGDIIIHLMSQNYRAKYNIEEFLEKLKKENS